MFSSFIVDCMETIVWDSCSNGSVMSPLSVIDFTETGLSDLVSSREVGTFVGVD
jgi:hypothetical protein